MSTTFTSGTTIKSAEVNANFLEKKPRTYSTTATAAGTTTLTVSSNQLQLFTGTTTQTVTLPVASTMSLGYGFEIFNLSTGVVTVNSSGANSVQAMASGSKLEVICILASGTTAASWQVIYTPAFATGILPIVNGGTGQTTQTAAFNALSPLTTKGDLIVNDGTNDIRLAVGTNNFVLVADSTQAGGVKWASQTSALSVVAKTTTYTATTADDIINASGSAFTITLYAASGNSGKSITIKKTDASLTNVITIDGDGAETIDGSTTTTLNTQYETVTLYCDGSNWHTRNRNIPSYVGTFTPTGSWSTNTTYTGRKRRIGDSYEYMIKVSTAGAPTAASLTITLPDAIDTSKLTSTGIYASAFENSGIANDSGSAYPVKVLYNSTTVVSIVTGASPAALVSNTAPFTFGAGDEINVRFTLPIVGLSN